MLQFDDVSFLQ